MTMWQAYRVVLELLSPLHVGRNKVGNVQMTYPYVTGRVLWGALTAQLVSGAGGGDYVRMGQRVDEQLAFSYFFPATSPGGNPSWPWADGELLRREFAWEFLGSYSATALQDGHAAEGSLHETEFIAPRTRSNKPVYMVGYVFERASCELDWRAALAAFQAGGERSYGWGRMALQESPAAAADCFGFRVVAEGDRPQLDILDGHQILAHAHAKGLRCAGRAEPLVGRETDRATGTFGRNLSYAGAFWVPGSRLSEGRTVRVEVASKGTWRASGLDRGPARDRLLSSHQLPPGVRETLVPPRPFSEDSDG